MAIASNRRLPKVLRMKARIASHKPLSTLLARVKRKVNKSDSEEESEDEILTTKLNKISLNNQIVTMRKNVKRAKLYTINKLTRTIAKLRKAKGTEQTKAKLNRKAERLLKKVKCVKALSEDEVSLLALTTSQDLDKLSTDIKMPMSTQAMATIAKHKFVTVPVEEFKKAFPDLDKTAKVILKKKKKQKFNTEIQETLEDRRKSEKKSKPNRPNKGNGDKEENNSCNESGSDDEDKNSEDYDEKGSEREEKKGESEDEESDEDDHNEDGGTDMDEDISSNNEVEQDNNESESEDKLQTKLTKANHNMQERKSKHLSKSDKPLLSSGVNHKKKNVSTRDGDKLSSSKNPYARELEVQKPKVVDQFFMTVDDKEYVTNQTPALSEENNSNQNMENKINSGKFNRVNNNMIERSSRVNKFNRWDNGDDWRKTNFNDRPSYNRVNTFGNRGRDWQTKFNKQGPPYRKIFSNQFEKVTDGSGKSKFYVETRKERRKDLQQPIPKRETKVEKLHPSWEAKRKQVTVANFQGKKIKFD